MASPKGWIGKTGEQHPAWKGGFRVDEDGYIRTYSPKHPWPRKGGYVPEHVRVMELHIGRRIKQGEVIHHLNHKRQDNRLDNLILQTASEHSRHHRHIDGHLYKHDPLTGRFMSRKEVPNA